MSKRNPKKFNVVGTGYVPCNKYKWKDARLVLYRPGYGIVSIRFSETFDSIVIAECQGDKVGAIGSDLADGSSWSGICFWADRVIDVSFSRKEYPSGDIRDMVDLALRTIEWPVEPKKYFLIGRSGEFWGWKSQKNEPIERR